MKTLDELKTEVRAEQLAGVPANYSAHNELVKSLERQIWRAIDENQASLTITMPIESVSVMSKILQEGGYIYAIGIRRWFSSVVRIEIFL